MEQQIPAAEVERTITWFAARSRLSVNRSNCSPTFHSLTTATGSFPCSSRSAKSRPAIMGIPTVEKNPGITAVRGYPFNRT